MSALGDSPKLHRIKVMKTPEWDPYGEDQGDPDDYDSIEIEWEFTCSPDDECHFYPACECEDWDPELHPPNASPAPGHESVRQDECWLKTWVDATMSDWMDLIDNYEGPGELRARDLRSGHVTFTWNGDYLTWSYADDPDQGVLSA